MAHGPAGHLLLPLHPSTAAAGPITDGVRVGDTIVTAMYVGDTSVTKAYVGDIQIFP